MRLCCFFNYAPLYREAIYREIDNAFDAQFCFGREVEHQKNSGIAKLDYSIFKKKPIEFDNKIILKHFLWRTKLLRQAFKSFDAYILTGDLSWSYIPFIVLCKILGKKVYAWGHGPKTRKGLLSPVYWWYLNNLTGFFAYGEGGRKRMIELGYNPEKVHVIYNSLTGPVDTSQDFKSDVYKKHFKNDDPTIQFIGRLTPQKKLDWLIDVHSDLNKTGQPCNLVIIGDGQIKNELQQLATEKGFSDRIWFYGECYDDNVNCELLYNTDLCVSPGNVGLTAIHSLQFGTPVISHNNFYNQAPEYECIEQNKTGMLYFEGNYTDFFNTIKKWLISVQGRREEIRQNCYAMINKKWNSTHQINILRKVLLNEE